MIPVKTGVSFSYFLGKEATVEVEPHEVGGSLDCYKKFVRLGLKAIEAVSQGQIPDPTVGENACQIRAAMFAEFINSEDYPQVLEESRRALKCASERLEGVQAPAKTRSKKEEVKDKTSFSEFLKRHGADVAIDERVFQLIMAYALTLCREPERGFSLNEKKVVQTWEVVKEKSGLKSEGFALQAARRVEKFAKKYIADQSVQFLQQCAKACKGEESSRLYPLVSGGNVKVTQLQLCTAPCFSGTECILANSRAKHQPLVVRVHQINAAAEEVGRETFFFSADAAGFHLVDRQRLWNFRAASFGDAISAAFPVLSRAELEQEFSQKGVDEILLAFMASHPVYGGDLKNLSGPAAEEAKSQAYAKKAEEWGCCPNNPRFCRFYHMYPVTLGQIQ